MALGSRREIIRCFGTLAATLAFPGYHPTSRAARSGLGFAPRRLSAGVPAPIAQSRDPGWWGDAEEPDGTQYQDRQEEATGQSPAR
jgi:hypothetical protein